MVGDVSIGCPTPPQRFQAVHFDRDGVLVDSETITNGVLRVMLHELGGRSASEECVDRFIGRALSDEFDVIEEHTGIRPDQAWLLEFRARRNTALAVDLQPVDGAVAAVAAIAAEFDGRIACASGATRAKIELQLAKVGLAKVFGAHVYSGAWKPSAASRRPTSALLAAAAGLGVDPGACAVVEDTVAGGRRGGWGDGLRLRLGRTRLDRSQALIAAGASRVFHAHGGAFRTPRRERAGGRESPRGHPFDRVDHLIRRLATSDRLNHPNL